MNQYEIEKIPSWTQIKVRWRDAYSPAAGWHDVEEYESRDSTATTYGRLWSGCQEHYITVVGTVFESELPNPETVSDINHIPIGWVLDIEILPDSQAYKE